MRSPLSKQLRLLLVTDRLACKGRMTQAVESALRGGATAVMLREKDLGAREMLSLAQDLRVLTKQSGALLIVNDRVDVALAVGADGAHLGWRSLPIPSVRRLAGPEFVIGASTHSLAEARQAESEGADYITFGPIFHTPSKEGLVEPQGIEGLKAAHQAVRLPLIGLGGINETNAASVAAAGADGAAVIRALMSAGDPERTAQALRAAFPFDDCRNVM